MKVPARRTPLCCIVLALAVACATPFLAAEASAPVSLQQAGAPDPGFGTDGRVILSVDDEGGLTAPQSVLLPEGKILSVGIVARDTLFLVRKLSEGWPDTSFGQGGATRTILGIGAQYVLRDRVLLPDGRLLLAGHVSHPDGSSTLLYVRFTSEGRLDPTFGTGGLSEVDLPLSTHDVAQHIALQPDGNIVAVARSSHGAGQWNTVLLRLMADGRLDPGFGTGGIAAHPLNGSIVKRVHILPDGKLLLSGSFLEYALLSRHHADGRIDAGFGDSGHFRLLAPGTGDGNRINDAAVQGDGRIVVVGSAGSIDPTSMIARVEADGSRLDAGFNGGRPILVPSPTTSSMEEAVAVQPDGRIVSLGKEYAVPTTVPARLLRLHADGRFDTGFGQEGKVLTDPVAGARHLLNHLQVQPDGKYLVSGLVQDDVYQSLGVFRFLP